MYPKNYNHTQESELYARWETAGVFQPNPNATGKSSGKPFSILMPPPNANASLHAGHAMYVIQDILIRFHRMLGDETVWFPGTDHAGYETQFVYEKHLAKQGTSRFQFDRDTLYQNIHQFVKENSGLIVDQMKQLGFSADWTRQTFTLDKKVIDTVLETFSRLHNDKLIYRDTYLVNYCPKCGTTFADLETDHEERITPLVYVKYRFSDGEPRVLKGKTFDHLVVATVRPETIFADVAIAIHPDDPRAVLAGEFVRNPLTHAPIPIILDPAVDPKFGTGVLKITPAHDPVDYAVGVANNFPITPTIDIRGKITLDWWNPTQEPLLSRAEQLKAQFHGMGVVNARQATITLLEAENSVEKIDTSYKNNVLVCYKLRHPIEPLPYPNWFIHMEPLAKLGLQAIEEKHVSLIPSRFIKLYKQWLDNIRDWPISRQIVWGIRMPIWYDLSKNPDIFLTFLNQAGEQQHLSAQEALKHGFSVEQIRDGLQTLIAPLSAEYVVSTTSPGETFVQETDTFDTWFSSGQWPLVTTGYPDKADFLKFYPTSVLDSMWDILFFWIARMIMLGAYLTKDLPNPKTEKSEKPESRGIVHGIPFQTVYLHSMVTDEKGAKMSKSKGNVVNPLDIVNEFGADALRISLVAGSAPGNPIALSMAKVKGYRNFGNKLWNIGRFLSLLDEKFPRNQAGEKLLAINIDGKGFENEADAAIIKKQALLTKSVTQNLEKLRFSEAALELYDFAWNDFANGYLEENKHRQEDGTYLQVVRQVLMQLLVQLHPFMPFVTEAIYQELRVDSEPELLALHPWE